MKRTISVETDDIESSTETGGLIENTPRRMSYHETESASSVSVTYEEFALKIRAATDPLSQQLAHL